MLQIKNKRLIHLLLAAFMAVSSLTVLGLTQHAHADTMGEVFVRFDRMATSAGTTGTVCAKPSVGQLASTEAKVAVTFPTGFTFGTYTTFTVDGTTNLAWPTGGTAWPGITAPTGAGDIVGQTVTFASSDLSSSSTLYCFNWTSTSAVIEPSSANPDELGSITTKVSGGTTIDTGQFATATITNDQIVVTATVPVAFSFALSGNTDALGTLDRTLVKPSPTPRTATVNTNAKNGWMVWAKDLNTGLTSASASKTIASTTPGSNSTLSSGTEGYNTGITSSLVGGASITVATPFVGGSLGKGGGLDTSLRTLASSTGVADTAVLTLTNNVAISGATAAATDYTDTITVVGAGLF